MTLDVDFMPAHMSLKTAIKNAIRERLKVDPDKCSLVWTKKI